MERKDAKKKEKGKEIKEKGFRHWMRTKIAREPVLIGDIDLVSKEKMLAKVMQDNGYFNAGIHAESVINNNKTSKIRYDIDNPAPTYIDSVFKPRTGSELDPLFRQFDDHTLIGGDIYKLDHIKQEREDMTQFIRNEGYFDFDKNAIIYLVDTSGGGDRYDVQISVNRAADTAGYSKHYIRNIHLYPTWNPSYLDIRNDSSSKARFFEKMNYYVWEDYRYTSRKIFKENIFIESGKQFNLEDHHLTSSRLAKLGLFKYVNINYEEVARDSLDVVIKLAPAPHQNVKTSVEVSSSSRGYLGSTLGFTYNNRNVLRWAVNMNLAANVGTELQFVNGRPALNILDVSLGIDFTLPRRLRFNPGKELAKAKYKLRSANSPKTTISIEQSFEKWIQYYTMNDLNFEFSYTWTKAVWHKLKDHDRFIHKLTPINLSWLYLLNSTGEFEDILNENALIRKSFENNFIIGAKYSILFYPGKIERTRNHFEIRGSIESSGNLAYLAGKAIKPSNRGRYAILNTPISQFMTFDIDARNVWKINEKTMLVARINPGIGIAFGNSDILPYSRQFYMGGPNTVRAYKFRTIGPGRYSSEAFSETDNPVEQTGDIKLLLNLEYRYTIYKFIKGAAFLDAGNVWLLRFDEERPNAEFNSNFIRQIALGTGMGLRLDFNYFAIRLDLGIPIFKPNEKKEERWLHQFPSVNLRDWRKQNFAWNFAIGYPF